MSQLNNNSPTGMTGSERVPRRIVLLAVDEAMEKVLAEYQGTEISGKRLHTELQRFAREHHPRRIAAEWLGPRGWVRFLWAGTDGDRTATDSQNEPTMPAS
jgi:hypothetical protein